MSAIAEPERAESGYKAGRYAAIDIGTVTCRMLVADVDEAGRLHELDREYAITNLGEGVDATGVLKPEAMRRVADTVARFLDVLRGLATPEHPAITMKAMATSAARDARNADEFEALLASLGVTLSVIPGEREAALSFAGASCDFLGERLLVVDIGGGSTEVIAGRAGGRPDRSHSFNIGCRRVTEKFFVTDPPSAAELERARAWVEEDMRPYFDELRGAGFAPERLVAVAGTATTVVYTCAGGRTAPTAGRPAGRRAACPARAHRRARSGPGARYRGGHGDPADGARPGRRRLVHGERVGHPSRHHFG